MIVYILSCRFINEGHSAHGLIIHFILTQLTWNYKMDEHYEMRKPMYVAQF